MLMAGLTGSDLVVGEWSWAPVDEVVAWARFWAGAPWPMTEDVAIDLGVEHLGWSVDEKGAAVSPWPLNRPGCRCRGSTARRTATGSRSTLRT